MALAASQVLASDFSEPWKREDRALVIDAYEYNSIDWTALATDKRIVGFINKASDGLPPPYACKGDETEVRLCRALFRRHAVAKELFQTRRTVARALGLKWGAYHLARPGNPIEQANNFIDFARPGPDDLMALDIEDNDPEKWMSLADAEEFVRHVHRRVGRFPVLYTNGSTAQHIADHRHLYPLLSRLPLWYARYKPEIDMHFPKGNWRSYALWQFATQANCNARRCPYRVPGTPTDIDVNVAAMTAEELRTAWPFGGLVGVPVDMLFRVPVPVARADALEGEVTIAYVNVAQLPTFSMLAEAAGEGWRRMRYGWAVAMSGPYRGRYRHGMAEYAAGKLEAFQQMIADAESAAGIDPIATGSIPAADSAKD
jgi:GH25 family lysozyme M1 (1,4-beta-N-acetylmuramidase)